MTQSPAYPPDPMYQSMPVEPPRPTAVTAVAVIGIVLASLGLICNGIGTVFGLVAAAGLNPGAAAQAPLPTWVNASAAGEALISFFIDIAWIVICVGLLRLSPWARAAAVKLGVAHVVWLLVTTAFGLAVVAPITKEALEHQLASQPPPTSGPNAAAMSRSIATLGAYAGPVVVLLFGLILPVMMLITMTRQSMKALFVSAARPPAGT